MSNKIDTTNWKEFRVGDIFDTSEKGNVSNSTLLDETDKKDYYYVGAKKKQNGFMKYVIKLMKTNI